MRGGRKTAFTKDGLYRCQENPGEEEVFIETAKVNYAKLPLQCSCRKCSHTICAYHPMQREAAGLPQQTTLPRIEFIRPKTW